MVGALTSGYDLAFIIGAACVAIGLASAFLFLHGRGTHQRDDALTDEQRREFEAHAL
jgi:hypothetical protein